MIIQEIDKWILNNEVSQRKEYLIKQLHNMGIYYTTDGRKLEDVSLYTLEWTHIEMMNEVSKAYGESYC